MALVKPIAQSISAFDATQDKTFSFTSSGGSQVVANRLTIRLQSDNSVVYQNKVTSYRFEQTVPKRIVSVHRAVEFTTLLLYFNKERFRKKKINNSNISSKYKYCKQC